MNNLLSYCGLVDARISASEKDLPVTDSLSFIYSAHSFYWIFLFAEVPCLEPEVEKDARHRS